MAWHHYLKKMPAYKNKLKQTLKLSGDKKRIVNGEIFYRLEAAMTYQVPKVWQWHEKNDNAFASINRPTAGARFEQALSRGQHALQLYSLATPNGQKVTIMLEELLALGIEQADYDAWLINIGQGDQFGSGFVEINPNSKIPALVDYGADAPLAIFESGAILLYLAEKFGHFLPQDTAGRSHCLSWLFWQVGTAPLLGGGFGHFYAYADEKQEYPINRFTMEVKRQMSVLDQQLAKHAFIAGDSYSIADMAIWPWFNALVTGSAYHAAEFLQASSYQHLMHWCERLAERPAVKRGILVNSSHGIQERHSRADLDALL